MKHITTSIFVIIISILVKVEVYSQIPEIFNYQALISENSGKKIDDG